MTSALRGSVSPVRGQRDLSGSRRAVGVSLSDGGLTRLLCFGKVWPYVFGNSAIKDCMTHDSCSRWSAPIIIMKYSFLFYLK